LGPKGVPYVRLLLPGLSRPMSNTFMTSNFIHSTQNSSYADSWAGIARNNEADVVCIQIRMTRNIHMGLPPRLCLFVSKRVLLEVASASFSHRFGGNQPGFTPISPDLDVSHAESFAEPTWDLPIHSIPYLDWSASGKFVRWIDGSSLRGVTRCARLGSKFACIGDPYDLGLARKLPARGSHTPFVCIMEFNTRLFSDCEGQGEDRVIDSLAELSPLIRGIAADIRSGLPFKVAWFDHPSASKCVDLLLGNDHVLLRLVSLPVLRRLTIRLTFRFQSGRSRVSRCAQFRGNIKP